MSSPEKEQNKKIPKTKKRKVLLIVLVVVVVFTGLLAGAVLYGYYHPSMIKGLLEKGISSTTGSHFTIDELSYSLSPCWVRASGIQWRSSKDDPSYQLSIKNLQANLVLEGPWGGRDLVIRSLTMTDPDLALSLGAPLPGLSERNTGSSPLFVLFKKWFSICFFRGITLEAGEIRRARAIAHYDDLYMEGMGFEIQFHRDKPLNIAFKVRLQFPSREIFVDLPQCSLKTDGPISFEKSKMSGHLEIANGSFTSPIFQANALAVASSFEYNLSHGTVDIASALFQGEVHPHRKKKEEPPLGLLECALRTAGQIRFGSKELEAYSARLSVGDLGIVNGGLKMIWGRPPSLSIETVDSLLRPHKIVPWLPDSFKGMLSSITLGGDYHLKGLITARPHQAQWRWDYDLKGRFEENDLTYQDEKIALKGRITGEIRANGSFPTFNLAARLAGTDFSLSTENIHLEPAEVKFGVSGVYPQFDIQDFVLSLPLVTLPLGKDRFSLQDVRLTADRGMVHGENREILFHQFFFDSSLLHHIKGSLKAGENRIEVSAKGHQTGLVKAALTSQLVPDGWEGDGADDVNVTWVKKKGASWTLDSQVDIKNLRFQDLQGRFMGEGLAIKSGLEGRFDPRKNRLSFKTRFEGTAGEILLDRFYTNFSQNSLRIKSSGVYGREQESWTLSPIELTWERLCSLKGNITVQEEGGDFQIGLGLRLPPTPLVPLFDQLILEPFQTEYPALQVLEMAGEISADLRLEIISDALEARGLVSWHHGRLTHPFAKDLSLGGITLDLPIWYQKGQPTFQAQKAITELPNILSGALSFQAALPPYLPKQSLVFPLKADRNFLSVSSSTRFQTAGGDILLGPMEIKDLHESPHIETTLSIQNFDPGPFLATFWPRPPGGSFHTLLDPIRFQNGTIVGTGEAEARIFGGILTFSDLSVAGLGQGTPVFRFDAQCENISLSELTKDTGFGKVEGILHGHIRNVEIAYGQPQKFDLLLETMPAKGVRQRISVRAVDNIAQLGGGQSPFIGAAGFLATFLKELPYSKIGVRASLENDLFNIRGTIRDQGKEYLIKRGSFSGVDIVNQNPDNRISFKDMMKRIKRIKPLDDASVVK